MISQRVIKRFCMVRALREKSLNPFNCRWTIGKSEKSYEISHSHAFTLIELLIVIAIIAILGSATVLVLNPVEIIKQGRDGTRITDVENIQKSLNLTLFNNPSLVDSLLSTNIYLSLPSGSCPLSPPTGYAYVCNATSANINKTDGTGWIPLTLQNMASLPTDPNSNFYYAFIANPTTKTFTVTALLESEKQTKLSAAKDGGTDPGRFEKGDTGLWSGASGLVAYYPFEGIGVISNGQMTGLQDLSGNNNNGTATNTNGTGMTFATGKVGSAIQFDGVDDWMNIAQPAIGFTPNVFTVMGIIYPDNQYGHIITPQSNGVDQQISYENGGTRLRMQVAESSDTNERTRYSPSGSMPVSIWTSWAISVNDKNIKMYINGVLVSEYNETINIGNWSNNWVIGQRGIGTYWYKGKIDELRVYSRVLSTAEIQAIYNSSK